MTRAFDGGQLRLRGDEFQRSLQLFDRSETVTSALNKQRWLGELRGMIGAQAFRFARRVKRIGRQQQTVGNAGIFSAEHAALAASVGVASEKDLALSDLAHAGDGIL